MHILTKFVETYAHSNAYLNFERHRVTLYRACVLYEGKYDFKIKRAYINICSLDFFVQFSAFAPR